MSHAAYMPDAALFPRAAAGDGPALAALVGRHAARLYDLAFRLTGDPARAAEAVAGAFTGLATGALPPSPDAPVLVLESAVASASLALAGAAREQSARGAEGETVAALALLPVRDRAILELTARRSLPDTTVAALLNLPPERLGDARAATERAFNAAMLLRRAHVGAVECAALRAIGRSREQERLPAAAAHLVACPNCAATARTLPDPATALRALPALPLTPEGADDILWRVTRALRHEADHTALEATPIEAVAPTPARRAPTPDTRAGAPPTAVRARPQPPRKPRPRATDRLATLLRAHTGAGGRRQAGRSLDRYLHHRSPLRLLLPLALLAALAAAGAEHFASDVSRGRPAEGAATIVTSRSTLPPRPTTVARVAPSPIPEEPAEAPPAQPTGAVVAVATAATVVPTQGPARPPATPPAIETPAPAAPTPARPTAVAAAPTGTTTVTAIGAVPAATPTVTVAASRPQAPPIVSSLPSPALRIPVMVSPQPAPTPTPTERVIPPAPSAVGRVPVDTPAAEGTARPVQPGTARLALEEGDFDFGLEAGPRTLRLVNTGGDPLEWRVAADSAWVGAAPAAGTIAPGRTAQIEVTIVRGTLPAGDYTGALQVLTNGGDGLVPVTMAVAPGGITVATATASPPPAPTASSAPSSTRTATAAPATTRATVAAPPPTTAPAATTAPSPTRTIAATPSPTTAPSPNGPTPVTPAAATSSPTTQPAPTVTPSNVPRTPGAPRTASPAKP